ncbi:MAG: FAD:protein FMN transferase [Pseudomonadota bacterium]|nr:MAG: FAD:protein FMN transferase [Pseudomonadota bacterium]
MVFALNLPAPARAEWFKSEQAVMGTSIAVQLWHTDADFADACIAAVMSEMHRIDAAMSPYKESSELSKVNREAARFPVAASKELFDLIARSLEMSERSGGAFDITYASVGRMYDYRARKKPGNAEIETALKAVNYHHIKLDRARGTIRFTHPGVYIDLGGIAKGHAVDRGISLLRERGIRHALVSAGGDSRILGDRRGRPWFTGIKDPRNPQRAPVVLPLSDTAISTSGDYERYFIEDGVRYHHIINPGTGRSARAARSVTVLGPDATTTDALSTTLFVLGPEKALKLADTMPEIDAIIIDSNGTMHYSSGLEPPAKQ